MTVKVKKKSTILRVVIATHFKETVTVTAEKANSFV